MLVIGVGGHPNVVSSRRWEGGAWVRSVTVEAVAFVVAEVDEVGQFVAVRFCCGLAANEDGWLAGAVEDVGWCGKVGVAVDKTFNVVVDGLVEKWRGAVEVDDVVEIVGVVWAWCVVQGNCVQM